LPPTSDLQQLADRNPGHVNALHAGPDDGQTTGFGREGTPYRILCNGSKLAEIETREEILQA
jgi:hypothetical protein